MIDPDILATATHWATTPRFAAWIAAIQQVEGGRDAFLRAVQCSVPSVTTRPGAIEVACRTTTHQMFDFLIDHGLMAAFIDYFGTHWAPPHVANDPTQLNAHWVPNMMQIFLGDGA